MPQWLKKISGIIWLKLGFTGTATVFIVVHLIFPDLKIDSITIGLLVFAALPWFSTLIESAKLPGGWEVKFRDLKNASDDITQSSTTTTTTADPSLDELPFLTIANRDPNLALAGLRIEIEKRVKLIAVRHGVKESFSIRQTLDSLSQAGVFDYRAIGGLDKIINAANAAIHGAPVEPSVAEWAIQ
ncbi:hypothetical protein [Gimesia sp.]|uniref:hypothetical protein n=1 Tax=Gimesia sp. TaxID=2024833 RepID=UPI003A931F7C